MPLTKISDAPSLQMQAPPRVWCIRCKQQINAYDLDFHWRMNHAKQQQPEPEPWMRKHEWEQE
jgi:hypothetical protein